MSLGLEVLLVALRQYLDEQGMGVNWFSAGGVVVSDLTPEGREQVYLVRIAKTDRWELPKGRIEPGEDPRRTAVREVGEETGLAVQPLAYLGKLVKKRSLVQYWLMLATGGTPGQHDSEEVAEVRRVTWDGATTLLRDSGNMRDITILKRAREALARL